MSDTNAIIIRNGTNTVGPAPQNVVFDASGSPPEGNVYGVWADLVSAIADMRPGVQPIVTFTADFTVPVGVFDMKSGRWESVSLDTGAVTVTLPDGVTIDNPPVISNGLLVNASPTTADGTTFTFSNPPPGPGAPWILAVTNGAALENSGTKALVLTPGTGVFMVFASEDSSLLAVPASTAPFVKSQGTDVIIGSQFNCGTFGGLPDGWLEGTGANLIYQNGIESTYPAIPGWVGPAPIIQNTTQAKSLNYVDTAPLLGSTNVQGAIDALKAQVVGPVLVYAPGSVAGGNVYVTEADLAAAAITVKGPKTIWTDGTNAPGDGFVHFGAGTWDLGPFVTFATDPNTVGQANEVGASIIFDDGAHLGSFPLGLGDCFIQGNGSTPIVSEAGSISVIMSMRGQASQTANGTAPLWQLTDPGSIFLLFQHDDAFLGDPASTAPVFDGAGSVYITMADASTVLANSLSSVGGIQLVVGSSSCYFSTTQLGGGGLQLVNPENAGTNVPLYALNANGVAANTAAETSIVGTGAGSPPTAPQGVLGDNGWFDLTISGFFGTAVIPPTLQIRIKLAGTLLLDTTAVVVTGGLAGAPWRIRTQIGPLNADNGGDPFPQAFFEYQAVNPGPLTAINMATAPGAGTTFGLVDVTAQWGTADPANTITCTNLTIEAKGVILNTAP